MTTVAFIGLGIMGGPMAANLVKAGYPVVGYNRHPEPVERLVAAGGHGASSVAEAVAGADIVITMLPDSPDVESVALGDDGVFANAKSGLLYIDCSTIRPDVSARMAAEGAENGIRVVDAPVSGGEQGAIDDHGGRVAQRLHGGPARAGRGGQDRRPRRSARLGPDGQGGQPAHRRQLPVVVEIMLERITNISMGTELDNITEFEELAEHREHAPTSVALLD